jgi:hypothetical protein
VHRKIDRPAQAGAGAIDRRQQVRSCRARFGRRVLEEPASGGGGMQHGR